MKSIAAGGGIISAIAASSCCAIPLALFALGIGGAWVGNLTALAPYQPLFVAFALGFLAMGVAVVRRSRKIACAEGTVCATPLSDRIARSGLWIASVLIIVAMAFPYAAPWLLGT